MFDILENIPSLGFLFTVLVLKMSLSRELMVSKS